MTLLSNLSFVSVTKKMARTQNFPSKRQHRTVGTIITIPRASTLLQFLKREECWEGGGGNRLLAIAQGSSAESHLQITGELHHHQGQTSLG